MSYLPQLREALQDIIAKDDELIGDAVLTGYVVVAEWHAPDGQRWMTKSAGDLNDNGPAIWTVQGWLYHALETAQRDVDEAGEDGES